MDASDRSRIYLITDIGHGSKYFNDCKITVSLKTSLWRKLSSTIPGFRFIEEIALGIKCWLVSVSYKDEVPIVTFAGSHGFVFAFLQYCFRFFFKPRAHVVFDLLLMRKRRGILGLFDNMKMGVFSRAVDLAIVWGETDPEDYSREYNIPKEKFLYHHYHTTMENFEFKIGDEGYIFAGGNTARDYRTFIEAVKSIDHPVFIATTIEGIKKMAEPWKHIEVSAVTPGEFYQKMASCKMLVECHLPDSFRTVGHQTMLNAMWMGKPVVIADRNSARGYIDDEEEGLVVDSGDIEGVRAAIIRLLQNPDLAGTLAGNSMRKARDKEYSIARTMQSIYNIAIRLQCEKAGLDPADKLLNKY